MFLKQLVSLLLWPWKWFLKQIEILRGWVDVSVWTYKVLWKLCPVTLVMLSLVVAANALSVFLVGKCLEWTLDQITVQSTLSPLMLALPITVCVGSVWLLERFLKTLTIDADSHIQDYFGGYFPKVTKSWGMRCFDGGTKYFEMLTRGKRAEYSLGFYIPQQFRLLTNIARWVIGLGLVLQEVPHLWFVLIMACTSVLYLQMRSAVKFTLEDRRTWGYKAERTDMKKTFDYKLKFKAALAFGITDAILEHIENLGQKIFPPLRKWAWYLVWFESASILALIGVFFYASIGILNEALNNPEVTVGQVAFLLTSMSAVGYSLQMIVNIVTDQAKGADSLVDLVRYDAKKDSEHREQSGSLDLQDCQPEVEFKNFSFSYQSKGKETAILNNISFKLQPGKVNYLLGPNGSGKTTLVNTLGRLYDPDSDQVFVGGHDVLKWEVNALRRYVRQMPQTPIQLRLTFRQILAFAGGYGKLPETCPENLMWQALELSCLDRKVRSFKRQLDEPLGVWNNASEDLSGGQWRFTNFAMFFMGYLAGKAGILVLDEPWVNIDPQSSQRIQKSLLDLGASTLIISHEIHRIKCEDHVVFLDKPEDSPGPTELVLTGQHAGLLDTSASYRSYCGLTA